MENLAWNRWLIKSVRGVCTAMVVESWEVGVEGGQIVAVRLAEDLSIQSE
jgi:hypothetical protein